MPDEGRPAETSQEPKALIQDIGALFLRLGIFAFGGPAAHIAMMRTEVVGKRKWMDDKQFLDLLGLTQLIPGPNSTELAIHIGHTKGGWRGLVLAGLAFIIPAVLITLAFAYAYKAYGSLPSVQSWIFGLKPAIIAIILFAIWPMIRMQMTQGRDYVFGILALGLAMMGLSEIALIFGIGLVFLTYEVMRQRAVLFFGAPVLVGMGLGQIFWSFLKIGSILYGSGYVLFAFLEAELVQPGYLSKEVLMDAIAVGQITPGPVFSSVSFIGYQIASWEGAALATVGVFLPSFVFVGLLVPLVKLVKDNSFFASFLEGVNIASLVLIVVVCIQFSRETLWDPRALLIWVGSMIILWKWPSLNTAWLLLGSALMGHLLFVSF